MSFTLNSEAALACVPYKHGVLFSFKGKDDIFGADMKDTDTPGKSLYFVRALSYCDINKIEMEDLKEILQTYPEFADDFMKKFQVTFDLKMVSMNLLTFYLRECYLDKAR